jgi:hypothetical protein
MADFINIGNIYETGMAEREGAGQTQVKNDKSCNYGEYVLSDHNFQFGANVVNRMAFFYNFMETKKKWPEFTYIYLSVKSFVIIATFIMWFQMSRIIRILFLLCLKKQN